MAHLALYREWRPKTFDEVVEQKHAVYALRQSVISGQIAHAYLFSGTRGTGKTTMAKIFSRAINCLNPQEGNPCNVCTICQASLEGNLLDIVEMDAASNNSVDNIRRICDEVIFMPSQARFKVYIIDEVHMLSTGAFNALLKTLEEPPAHAVFILATTEPHRIPATILSRCQRYDFRRIPVESMAQRLTEIAHADGIDITPDALQTIASLADGALRDAISLLDQARAGVSGQIDRDQVLGLAGVVQDDFLQQVASAILNGQIAELLGLVEQLVMAGRDLARFVTDLAQHYRNLLVCQVSSDPKLLVRATSATLAEMKRLAGNTSSTRLVELIRGLSALLSDLRWAADGRTALEIGLIRLSDFPVASTRGMSGQSGATVAQTTNESRPTAGPAAVVSTPDSRQEPNQIVESLAAVPKVVVAAPESEPGPSQDTESMILPIEPVTATEPTPIPGPIAAATSIPIPSPIATATPIPSPIATPTPIPSPIATPTPIPSPIATPTTDPDAGPPLAIDATALWLQMQTNLLDAGHMTLYLFSRAARPMFCGQTMQLSFDPDQLFNQQELGQPVNLRLLREAAARAGHKDLDIKIQSLAANEEPACPIPSEDNWIQKIKNTAHSMGIPVKMEE